MNASLKSVQSMTDVERQARIDLAACYRLAAHFGLNEGIDNHFTLLLGSLGIDFADLGLHWSEVKASELHGHRFRRQARGAGPGPSKTQRCISTFPCTVWGPAPDVCCTRICPTRRRCACSRDPRLEMAVQSALAFHDEIAYDPDYTGLAFDDGEGERLAGALGTKSVLMMAHHGVLVVGETVPVAFERLYFLELRKSNRKCWRFRRGAPCGGSGSRGPNHRRTIHIGRQSRPRSRRPALRRLKAHARSQPSGLRELSPLPHPGPDTGVVASAEEARAAGLSRPFYVVVFLLALSLGINYIDRGALPTAGPLIRHDLGLSPEQFGVLSSAFFYVYAPIQIPVGWLAERFGAHKVLSCGLVVWATATTFMGAASGFWTLLLLRLLLGLGESAGFPCVSKLLACVVPLKSLGEANGIVALGYLMAPGVGIWLAGLLIDHVGWRGTFLVFGLTSLLWLLPWSRVRLPKPRDSAK